MVYPQNQMMMGSGAQSPIQGQAPNMGGLTQGMGQMNMSPQGQQPPMQMGKYQCAPPLDYPFPSPIPHPGTGSQHGHAQA